MKNKQPHPTNNILYSSEDIRQRVDELIDEIASTCDTENLVVLGILRGSFIFLADLVRGFNRHKIHPRIDFITLSSYGAGTISSGKVKIIHDIDVDLKNADVVVVDDILDTGRTLQFARDLFIERGASSVRTCVLLDKKRERAVEMEADHAGFRIDDVFVVGYGLDHNNYYRELPHIAKLTFDTI